MKRSLVAIAVMAAIVLTGCGSAGQDKTSCQIVGGDLSDSLKLLDRWQNGNAEGGEVLDSLDELASTARFHVDKAEGADVKAAIGSVRDASVGMYQAVNTRTDLAVGTAEFLAAADEWQAACEPLLKG